MHYNYEGFSVEEATNYIYSRIEIAGGTRSILEDSAVHAVVNFCGGAPRVINSVMTKALILGAQLNKPVIDTDIILAASNDLSLI